jgi:hypothetical protein
MKDVAAVKHRGGDEESPRSVHMKQFKALLTVGALIALANGCSTTTEHTENLLTAAGFKMLQVTNSQQGAHLNNLPEGKFITVHRNGTVYYTYPDAPKQVLYVGQQEQYREYLILRLREQMAGNQLKAVDEKPWEVWGLSGTGVGATNPPSVSSLQKTGRD